MRSVIEHVEKVMGEKPVLRFEITYLSYVRTDFDWVSCLVISATTSN